MTDKSPIYRIWQSPGSVLIQTPHGDLELGTADAIAIAAEITARLAPTQPLRSKPGPISTRKSRTAMGAPEFLAECVRLYVDESMGLTLTARRMGVSTFTVRNRLMRAGVQLRTMPHALAAKRAA